MMNRVDVLGFRVSTNGLQADVSRAVDFINAGTSGHYMACANPHSLVVAASDAPFSEALRDADLLLPDGSGVVLAAKLLGTPVHERVAGFEFFVELSKRANESGGVRYFFMGSTKDVLGKVAGRLADEYPNIELAGSYSPPYKPEFDGSDLDDMATAIRVARPDVLWVGMTAPKQEKWIHQHASKLGVPFTGAIGAVFDFYAGTVQRSPKWLCRLGLEWLPRFLREPRRLWRRNLVSSPLFVMRVLRQALVARLS